MAHRIHRTQLNRILMVVPVVFSIIALGLVVVNVAAGVPPQQDEGTAAHLFQLLILAQVPIVLLFIATSDWTRPGRPTRVLAVQALAGIAALGSLAWAGY